MWSLISWILLGLIAGALAKLIYPGDQGGGIFRNYHFRNSGCSSRRLVRWSNLRYDWRCYGWRFKHFKRYFRHHRSDHPDLYLGLGYQKFREIEAIAKLSKPPDTPWDCSL